MKIDGKEVVDAKRDILLHITAKDVSASLAAGGQRDGFNCAAEKCAERQLGVKKAKVNLAVTYVLKGRKWYRYWTSSPLRTEIVSFDRTGIFPPGDYWLLAVPKSAVKSRGKAHKLGAPKHGRPGHHRKSAHVLEGVRAHALCGLRSHGPKNKIHPIVTVS